MKDFYINAIFIDSMRSEKEITSFFMVKSISVKTGINKKQYLDLLAADKTGEISCKKWDVNDEELPKLKQIKEGDIVKIKAQITEWNGMKQLRIMKLRKSVKEDKLELADFVKSAPEAADDMYRFILVRAEKIADEQLKALCIEVLEEYKEKLMYYPAAHKNHHAERAGLLYHIKRMLVNGDGMCDIYTNLNRDLVATGVILHDIEKINELESNEFGISSGYKMEGMLLGHITQGVRELGKRMERLGLAGEKAIMVEHMILSHHYEPEFGSPKKPLFPEAEILHYLDIIDARMFDMENALEKTAPGEFSEKVWTLENRRLYKPKGI